MTQRRARRWIVLVAAIVGSVGVGQGVARADAQILNVPYTCDDGAVSLDVTIAAPTRATVGTTVTIGWTVAAGPVYAGTAELAAGSAVEVSGSLRVSGAVKGELSPMTGTSVLASGIAPGQAVPLPQMNGYLTTPPSTPADQIIRIAPGDFRVEITPAGLPNEPSQTPSPASTTASGKIAIRCTTNVAAGARVITAGVITPSASSSGTLPPSTTASATTATATATPTPSTTRTVIVTATATPTATASSTPQVVQTPLLGAATGEEVATSNTPLLALGSITTLGGVVTGLAYRRLRRARSAR